MHFTLRQVENGPSSARSPERDSDGPGGQADNRGRTTQGRTVPAKANRCPHCWSALANDVTGFCPFCRGSLAPKQKRRRGGDTPEAKAVTPPPVTPAPYQRYEPYEPSQPYEYHRPAPAQPVPAPVDYAAEAAPAGGGVAVAERDPAEFPGTPLPPGFFDALPEKARKPKSRGIPLRAIGVASVVVVGAIGGISQAADRNQDISSPARHLVKAACAEYRDFTTRLHENENDLDATRQAVWWFQSNVDRFAEAALLDPDLAAASEVVAWFDRAIEVDFAPIEAMTEDEIDAFEKPLAQACYNGPGRA